MNASPCLTAKHDETEQQQRESFYQGDAPRITCQHVHALFRDEVRELFCFPGSIKQTVRAPEVQLSISPDYRQKSSAMSPETIFNTKSVAYLVDCNSCRLFISHNGLLNSDLFHILALHGFPAEQLHHTSSGRKCSLFYRPSRTPRQDTYRMYAHIRCPKRSSIRHNFFQPLGTRRPQEKSRWLRSHKAALKRILHALPVK